MNDVALYEAEAEAIRNRIADTVEFLGGRLSPSRLIQDAKDEGVRALFGVRDNGLERLNSVRDEGARVLANLGDHGADIVDEVEGFVRENPLAAGVAAAFVGVLIVHNRPRGRRVSRPDYDDGDSYAAAASRPASRVQRYAASVGDTVDQARGGLGERFKSIRDKATSAFADGRDRLATAASDLADRTRAGLDAAQARASATASGASDRLGVGLDTARDKAADTAARARRAAVQAARATASAIHQEPEAAIAVSVIVGAFLALAATGGALDPDA